MGCYIEFLRRGFESALGISRIERQVESLGNHIIFTKYLLVLFSQLVFCFPFSFQAC